MFEYFVEIALHRENSANLWPVAKWENSDPPRIYVHSGTSEDKGVLDEVVTELRGLTGLVISYADDVRDANFHVYMGLAHSELYEVFPSRFRDIIAGNAGLFLPNNFTGAITGAVVGVARTNPNGFAYPRRFVDSFIWEEVTQAFGVMNDADTYRDSLFQQSAGFDITAYSPLDRRIIQLLYDPNVKAGMTLAEVAEVIEIVDLSQ